MISAEKFLASRLDERRANNTLRELRPDSNLIDFCSNDYLGFAHSAELKNQFESELKKYPLYKLGSTGSRLLAGNDDFTESLEKEIAAFHLSDSALIFNSGYDANVGLFSSIAQKGDTIITDELIHASIIDGVRLSYANRYVFKHNDIQSLQEKLKHASKSGGRIYIAIESVYSMDGDEAPIAEICNLANQYDAAVIVDEAHATGIFGKEGRGLVNELALESQIFARLITFGKGLGTHGAAVLGTEQLRKYLINFARSFIYTTASSFPAHLATKLAYRFLQTQNHQKDINSRIQHFQKLLNGNKALLQSRSPIQVLIVPGNLNAKTAALKLQAAGFDIRAVLSPTVKEGSERLRICLHNHNSMEEINGLAKILRKIC